MARIAFLVALAVYCTGSLGLAAAVSEDSLQSIAKRGSGVGLLDASVHSTHYNRKIGYAGLSSEKWNSSKYGMLLSNSYCGSFKCGDLISYYAKRMSKIPDNDC